MAIGVGTPTQALAGVATAVGAAGAILSPETADAVLGLFGQDRFSQLFKQTESTFKQYGETPTDRRLWKGTRDKSTRDYFFLLKYNDTVVQIPFNINPQRETVTEPHASTTNVTQGGGKLVNSEGGVMNDIVIQGQCGLYPNNKRERLPDSGIGSGLESIKFLETLFRRYKFLKRFGNLSKGLSLVYVNRRTEDAWVVEPKQFVREDAIEHNNSFSYTIVLETLYPYDGSDSKSLVEQIMGSIPGFELFDTVTQRLSETVDRVNLVAGQISAVIDGFANNTLAPLNSLAQSYADLKARRLPNLVNFKRDSTKSIIANLRSTAAALEAAGAGSALVNAIIKAERAVVFTLKLDKLYNIQPSDYAKKIRKKRRRQQSAWSLPDGRPVDPTEAQAAGGLTTTKPSEAAAADDKPKAQETSDTSVGSATSIEENPNSSVAITPSSSFDPAVLIAPEFSTALSQFNWEVSAGITLANIDPANSDFRTAVVGLNDDIQTIAAKLLGDPGRWVELVLLNNLRYPYVADQAYIDAHPELKDTVIAYGKPIVYPVPKDTPPGEDGQRRFRNETGVSVSLTPFERSLGNDILINEQTGDIEWTSDDIRLVYSILNLGQFIRFRMVSKKGTYRRSRRIGFSNYIGLSDGVTEAVIKAEGRGLFIGDGRIVASQVISAQQSEGALLVTMAVFVKNLQDPIIQTQKVG